MCNVFEGNQKTKFFLHTLNLFLARSQLEWLENEKRERERNWECKFEREREKDKTDIQTREIRGMRMWERKKRRREEDNENEKETEIEIEVIGELERKKRELLLFNPLSAGLGFKTLCQLTPIKNVIFKSLTQSGDEPNFVLHFFRQLLQELNCRCFGLFFVSPWKNWNLEFVFFCLFHRGVHPSHMCVCGLRSSHGRYVVMQFLIFRHQTGNNELILSTTKQVKRDQKDATGPTPHPSPISSSADKKELWMNRIILLQIWIFPCKICWYLFTQNFFFCLRIQN